MEVLEIGREMIKRILNMLANSGSIKFKMGERWRKIVKRTSIIITKLKASERRGQCIIQWAVKK